MSSGCPWESLCSSTPGTVSQVCRAPWFRKDKLPSIITTRQEGRKKESSPGTALPSKTSPRFAFGQQQGGRAPWQPGREVPRRLPTKAVMEVVAVLVPRCSQLRISLIVDILTLATYSRKYNHEGADFLINLWLFTEASPGPHHPSSSRTVVYLHVLGMPVFCPGEPEYLKSSKVHGSI